MEPDLDLDQVTHACSSRDSDEFQGSHPQLQDSPAISTTHTNMSRRESTAPSSTSSVSSISSGAHIDKKYSPKTSKAKKRVGKGVASRSKLQPNGGE